VRQCYRRPTLQPCWRELPPMGRASGQMLLRVYDGAERSNKLQYFARPHPSISHRQRPPRGMPAAGPRRLAQRLGHQRDQSVSLP